MTDLSLSCVSNFLYFGGELNKGNAVLLFHIFHIHGKGRWFKIYSVFSDLWLSWTLNYFFLHLPFPTCYFYIYTHTDVVHCFSKFLEAGIMSLLIVLVMPSVRKPLFFRCFFIKINNFTPYNDKNLYLQERWRKVSEKNVDSVILIGFDWIICWFEKNHKV